MLEHIGNLKHVLVRYAIYDAAIKLFTLKGFEETTIEEIVLAAGLSRRSFFRYFESKDDLLALSVVNYSRDLVSSVLACSTSLSSLQVIREIVHSGARHAVSQPRTRQTIEIALKSATARQAYQSRMNEAEECVAEAFAERTPCGASDDLEPRMLAALTMVVMNLTMHRWVGQDYKDLPKACEQVLSTFEGVFCEAVPTNQSYTRQLVR